MMQPSLLIATGVQYSVRQFIDMADRELGITLAEGQGVDEKAVVQKVEGDKAPAVKPGDVLVQVDPRYFRPAEVETLLGDPSKAKTELGWIPSITLQEMLMGDLINTRQHALLEARGYDMIVGWEV